MCIRINVCILCVYGCWRCVCICDRLGENRAQRGMRRRRKKIDLVLKIVLNKPNEGNG